MDASMGSSFSTLSVSEGFVGLKAPTIHRQRLNGSTTLAFEAPCWAR